MAVIAVPACLLTLGGGLLRLKVSDPRAFWPEAEECLSGCPRTGVVSSREDRLNRRLLGLVPRSLDSLALLILHCWYSSSSVLARRMVSRASSQSYLARRSSRWALAISSRSCCRSASHFFIEVASAAAAAVSFICRSLRTASLSLAPDSWADNLVLR